MNNNVRKVERLLKINELLHTKENILSSLQELYTSEAIIEGYIFREVFDYTFRGTFIKESGYFERINEYVYQLIGTDIQYERNKTGDDITSPGRPNNEYHPIVSDEMYEKINRLVYLCKELDSNSYLNWKDINGKYKEAKAQELKKEIERMEAQVVSLQRSILSKKEQLTHFVNKIKIERLKQDIVIE